MCLAVEIAVHSLGSDAVDIALVGLNHELRRLNRLRIRILIQQRNGDRVRRTDFCVRRRRIQRRHHRNVIARLYCDIARCLIDHKLLARDAVVKVTPSHNGTRHHVEYRPRGIRQNIVVTRLGVKDRDTPRIVREQTADRIHILRRKSEDNRILHVLEAIGLTVLQNRRRIELRAASAVPVLAHIVRDTGEGSLRRSANTAKEAILLHMAVQTRARHCQRIAVVRRQ